jgi:hypothetical protein
MAHTLYALYKLIYILYILPFTLPYIDVRMRIVDRVAQSV